MLALHRAGGPDAGRCELAFEADEPLEAVADRPSGGRLPVPEPIVDESYGRSLGVLDPDGARVQVNEHDRSLST